MSKGTLILFVTFLLSACTNNGSNSSSKKASSLNPEEVLTGNWVNEQYVKEIQTDTSIRKAQDILMVVMFPGKFKDTGYYSPYMHAGVGTFLIIKDSGGYKIDRDIFHDADDTNSIEIMEKSKIKIGDVTFVKSHDTNSEGAPALPEEFLFMGKYKMANGRKVEFTGDGQINGLDTLKYYSVQMDYYGDAMQYVDHISMGRGPKNMHEYGFKFHKDTLFMCTLAIDTASGGAASFGQLLYKMWRKK